MHDWRRSGIVRGALNMERTPGQVPFTALMHTSVGGDLEIEALADAPELLGQDVQLALDPRCGGETRNACSFR